MMTPRKSSCSQRFLQLRLRARFRTIMHIMCHHITSQNENGTTRRHNTHSKSCWNVFSVHLNIMWCISIDHRGLHVFRAGALLHSAYEGERAGREISCKFGRGMSGVCSAGNDRILATSIVSSCKLQQNSEWFDILVPAYPGCPGKCR